MSSSKERENKPPELYQNTGYTYDTSFGSPWVRTVTEPFEFTIEDKGIDQELKNKQNKKRLKEQNTQVTYVHIY